MFDKQKKSILSKLDKSKKGSVDKDIISLVKIINSNPNYYTTSSCSGRILLIEVPEIRKKQEIKWHYLTHNKTSFSKVKQEINKILKKDIKNTVWFREESLIIHICCRTIEDASKLIEIAKHIGFKRSGINTLGKKIMLELVSTENMDAPVIKDKLLVDDNYLKILVKEANKKLKITKEKIKKLFTTLQECSF